MILLLYVALVACEEDGVILRKIFGVKTSSSSRCGLPPTSAIFRHFGTLQTLGNLFDNPIPGLRETGQKCQRLWLGLKRSFWPQARQPVPHKRYRVEEIAKDTSKVTSAMC